MKVTLVILGTGETHVLDHGAMRARKHQSIGICLISHSWSKQTLTITASAPFALPGCGRNKLKHAGLARSPRSELPASLRYSSMCWKTMLSAPYAWYLRGLGNRTVLQNLTPLHCSERLSCNLPLVVRTVHVVLQNLHKLHVASSDVFWIYARSSFASKHI